jgi:hypothetical protein
MQQQAACRGKPHLSPGTVGVAGTGRASGKAKQRKRMSIRSP